MAGLFCRTSGSGFRSRHHRNKPMATAAAVVPPIVGKLLVNGNATEMTSDFNPPPGDAVPKNVTAPTAVIAKISGGCTIGPKRFRRRTRHTALIQPTM